MTETARDGSETGARSGLRMVFLVGFMGAGKTSVGRALARRLRWRFVDLDDRIEAREQRTIEEIFCHSGEAMFRRAERAALLELLSGAEAKTVVALGGGAFVQAENARDLKRQGRHGVAVVFLDAAVQELHKRCARAARVRPLFQDRAQFHALYQARRKSYLKADIHVDTTGKRVSAVAAEVALHLDTRGEVSDQHATSS